MLLGRCILSILLFLLIFYCVPCVRFHNKIKRKIKIKIKLSLNHVVNERKSDRPADDLLQADCKMQ